MTYLYVPFAAPQKWNCCLQTLVCNGHELLQRKLLVLSETAHVHRGIGHFARVTVSGSLKMRGVGRVKEEVE